MYYSQVSPFAMDVLGNTLAFLVLLILCFLSGLSATDLDCGGVYTENEITIESPTYLNNPDGNITCDFIFKDDKCSTQYFFHFVNFYLEKTSYCSGTGLEIEEQDVLCGYQNGTKIYYSEYGILRVKFYSRQHKNDEKFKILVTKVPCDSILGDSRVKRSFHNRMCRSSEVPTTFDALEGPRFFYNDIQVPLIQQQNTAMKACCAARYDSKNFLISSLNFPYGKDVGSECAYHIYRANYNICKIRFNFLYYWNGYQTPSGCQNGYLEIDGKRICGCNTGLKLIADFGTHYGNFPKVIKFKSNGHSERSSGFVVEVLQEECLSNSGLINNAPYSFPHKRSLCPAFCPDSYIDIRFFYPSFLNTHNDLKCSGLGEKDLFALTRHPLWNYMPQCSNEKLPRKCVEISDKVGCLKTPGYPFYYPPNLDLCYRFIKSSGYCAVKLIMLDFLIQYSYQCSKDYVLLGNGKIYCGHQLYSTLSVLTFVNGTFEDVLFITDNSVSCRGFKAWFVQIPCTGITPSPTTKRPITTQVPTLPPTTIFTTEISVTTPAPTLPPSTITYPVTTTSTTEIPVTTPVPTLPPSTITYPVTTTSTTKIPVTTPVPTLPPSTITYPVTTTPTTEEPVTTPPPTIPPTPPPPPVTVSTTEEPTSTPTPTTTLTTVLPECVQEFSEEYFQIDINHDKLVDNTCRFSIRKYAPDACEVTLVFTNIPCQYGYLQINGRTYCDLQETTVLRINFYDDDVTVIYNKINDNGFNGGFVIDGSQTSNCIPDPEANLDYIGPSTEATKEGGSEGHNTSPSPDLAKEYDSPPYEIEIGKNTAGAFEYTIHNLNNDMCGLQINITSYINASPDNNTCNFLKHFERRVECIPLANHCMYAPYFEDKIEIRVPSPEIFDSMLFKEVRCVEKPPTSSYK